MLLYLCAYSVACIGFSVLVYTRIMKQSTASAPQVSIRPLGCATIQAVSTPQLDAVRHFLYRKSPTQNFVMIRSQHRLYYLTQPWR